MQENIKDVYTIQFRKYSIDGEFKKLVPIFFDFSCSRRWFSKFQAMELIKVTENNGTKLVDAKDLYNFLEVRRDFSNWIKDMIEFGGWTLGLDYCTTGYNWKGFIVEENGIAQKGESDNQQVTKRDYVLSIDVAKEISMIQRSEKGRQARQYFIECEKKLMAPALPKSNEEIIRQGYLALMQQVEAQQEQIKELAPAASYAKEVLQSTNNWTITTIASELGMTAQKLNQKLHELKIQYKDSDGVWVLYANHKDKGYTSSRTSTYHDSSNRPHTSITTTWTEKGRNFIHASFSQNLIKI